MKPKLDMNKIAKALGAQRRGKVVASGGYFGAMQLLADIQARFRVPPKGGRATNPEWTERRVLPLAPRTLGRLEEIARSILAHGGGHIEPMQVAALLLERTANEFSGAEVEKPAGRKEAKR